VLFAACCNGCSLHSRSCHSSMYYCNDSSVLVGPEMANVKVAKIFDALDLVSVCKREIVEHAIAHAIGQGLDSLMECCKVFENK